MRFSTTQPQEGGFYFIQYENLRGKLKTAVVEIRLFTQASSADSAIRAYDTLDGGYVPVSRIKAYAGPIPAPQVYCSRCGLSLTLGGDCTNVKCSGEHEAAK